MKFVMSSPSSISAVVLCTLLVWTHDVIALPKAWYEFLNEEGEKLPGLLRCDVHPTLAVMSDVSPHGIPSIDR